MLPNIKYVPPNEVCPNFFGMQKLENQLALDHEVMKKEGGGFCAMWTLFFAEVVLLNQDLTSREILDKIYSELFDNHPNLSLYLRNVIRGYLHYMYEYTQQELEQRYGINIDDINLKTETKAKKFQNALKTIDVNVFTKYNGVGVYEYFEKADTPSIVL
jgi:hypothetical protein